MTTIPVFRHRTFNAAIIWIMIVASSLLLLPSYYLFVFAGIGANFVAIIGLVILVGYSGQVSLGHGAFVGLGAYLCAILIDRTGLPYWQAVPATGAIAFGVGFLFGFPALRLEGLSLALTTFALAIVFPQIIKFKWFALVTGGTTGLLLDRPKSMLPQYLSVDQSLFLFVAFWAIGMYLLATRIGNSTLALTWRALRDHRVVAEAMGVNRLMSNNYAFAVSAMYGGVAGALWTVLTQFVAPDTFGFFLSLTLLVGAVVGGVHSILGALLGAAFIQFIPTFAESVSKSAPWAIYGIALLIVISVAPDGIAGLLQGKASYLIKYIAGAIKRT